MAREDPSMASIPAAHRWARHLQTLPALLLALYVSAPAPGVDKVGAFAVGCAARAIEMIALIEDHDNAGDVSPESLTDAGRTWMRARAVCHQGHVDEAVALYERVKATLGPAKIGQR
jgi:hypothetical protein